MLENELNICQNNKLYFEKKLNNMIKDPNFLLSQISENSNEEILSFNCKENNEFYKNDSFLKSQIQNLEEIIKYDYIPCSEKTISNGSDKVLENETFKREEVKNKNKKDTTNILPIKINQFEDEKSFMFFLKKTNIKI